MTVEHETSLSPGGKSSPGTHEIVPLSTQLPNSTEAEHSLIAVEQLTSSHNVTDPHSAPLVNDSHSDTSVDSECHEIWLQAGRIYHFHPASGTRYPMPIDKTELARQGTLHMLYKYTLGGALYLAPVGHARRVLDLGTGRGHWADDFALAHPSGKVCGTDLSPIQIRQPYENCYFVVDDFEEEWTWPDPFDFIHGRDLPPAVSDWPRLLEQIFKNLVPGGYIELQHQVFPLRCLGTPTRPDLELIEWSGEIMKSFARQPYNIQLAAAANIEELLRGAGFVNIHRQRFRWYLRADTDNQPKKTFSQNVRKILLEGLDAYSGRPFLEGQSQSSAQYGASRIDVCSAIENEDTCVYIPVDVVYAKKPDLHDNSTGIVAENQRTEHQEHQQAENQQIGHQTDYHKHHPSHSQQTEHETEHRDHLQTAQQTKYCKTRQGEPHLGDKLGQKVIARSKSACRLGRIEKQHPKQAILADANICPRKHRLLVQTTTSKIGPAFNPVNLPRDWSDNSGTRVVKSSLASVRSILPSEEFDLPNPHHLSGYRSILWYSFWTDNELLAKFTDGRLVRYLAMDIAEQNKMSIEEVERSLTEWASLGPFLGAVQKWLEGHKKDGTSQAYKGFKAIAREIRTDGLNFLEGYHSRPLDLIYWKLRLHLSVGMGGYVHGTAATLYLWGMVNTPYAELYFATPGGEEQRWTFEVDLLHKPLTSLQDRGVFLPVLSNKIQDTEVRNLQV